MATNGNFAQQELQSAHGQPISSGADASATYPDIKKDEVGWYFVEQYYTTLSRAPEKLHVRALVP